MCTTAVADDVKRVSANGTELSYVEAGQGEPVIFVHGGLQDHPDVGRGACWRRDDRRTRCFLAGSVYV